MTFDFGNQPMINSHIKLRSDAIFLKANEKFCYVVSKTGSGKSLV